MANHHRRTILRHLVALPLASAAVVPAPVCASSADPVFEKIEEHRAAIVVWLASADDNAETWAGYQRTQQVIWDTPPTTAAGVKALLKFGLERAEIESMDDDLPYYIEAALTFPLFATGGARG